MSDRGVVREADPPCDNIERQDKWPLVAPFCIRLAYAVLEWIELLTGSNVFNLPAPPCFFVGSATEWRAALGPFAHRRMFSSLSVFRSRRLAVLVVALVSSAKSQAQLATPTSHWGGSMFPEVGKRREWGLHFLGFTRYGKEVDSTGKYLFTPYNDMQETLGFNILSFTSSDMVDRGLATESSLGVRWSIFGGIIDDHIPRALQNRVIHAANWRSDKLRPVPRDTTDSPDSISLGPTKLWPPVIGYSREYFLRTSYTRARDGSEERIQAPYFLGVGFVGSTLNQEAFLNLGSDVVEFRLPPYLDGKYFGVRSVGGGMIARTGVLLPGMIFDDLTATYANLQGVGRLVLDVGSYPIRLDFAVTATDGFWVKTRSAEQLREIAEVRSPARSVYQAKSGLAERFVSLRVRIGGLTFETYNDLLGGKDKGPSFGAHVAYALRNPWEHPTDSVTSARRGRR